MRSALKEGFGVGACEHICARRVDAQDGEDLGGSVRPTFSKVVLYQVKHFGMSAFFEPFLLMCGVSSLYFLCHLTHVEIQSSALKRILSFNRPRNYAQ